MVLCSCGLPNTRLAFSILPECQRWPSGTSNHTPLSWKEMYFLIRSGMEKYSCAIQLRTVCRWNGAQLTTTSGRQAETGLSGRPTNAHIYFRHQFPSQVPRVQPLCSWDLLMRTPTARAKSSLGGKFFLQSSFIQDYSVLTRVKEVNIPLKQKRCASFLIKEGKNFIPCPSPHLAQALLIFAE